jgi:hypothetical protein
LRRRYTRHLTILFPAVLIAAVFFMIQPRPEPENPANNPPQETREVPRNEGYFNDEAHREQRALRWEVIREVMIERGLITQEMSHDDARARMREMMYGSEAQQDMMADVRIRLLERGIEPGRWVGRNMADTHDSRFGLNGIGYFEGRGVALGDTVPALTVYKLDGSATKLSECWRDKPALVVTGSLTCDITRERIDQLNALARRFDGRIHIVLLYTLEAMPSDSPAPGPAGEALAERPGDTETPVRPQPKTLADRIRLATELRDTLGVRAGIVIDDMDNAGWSAFGHAPAMAALITPDSKIAVKQGWFDAFAMAEAAETVLAE